MKISIDNETNSPQYLGVASLRLLQLGNDFQSEPLQGKNCSRRKLHASKEKGCQEKETLTVRETILRTNQKVHKSLSREAPLRGFFIDREPRSPDKNAFVKKWGVVPKAASC
jgi:hypothetical protein